MTSNKIENIDWDALSEDVSTEELEVLTESDIVAIEANTQIEASTDSQRIEAASLDVLPDGGDDFWPTSRDEVGVRAEIGALQSEIEQLRSDAVELSKEKRAFKELRDKIADELKEATRRIAEMTALLSQRDDEIAALKSALGAKASTEDDVDGPREVEAKAARASSTQHREFDNGETRKLVLQDAYASREFVIAPGHMSLGSAADNDIRIENSFISRHHAQIFSSSIETTLKDLNSTNGTYVNSRRINKCALHDGDSITIGELSFTFLRQRGAADDIRSDAQVQAPELKVSWSRRGWQ